jgi:hypothetical protein
MLCICTIRQGTKVDSVFVWRGSSLQVDSCCCKRATPGGKVAPVECRTGVAVRRARGSDLDRMDAISKTVSAGVRYTAL